MHHYNPNFMDLFTKKVKRIFIPALFIAFACFSANAQSVGVEKNTTTGKQIQLVKRIKITGTITESTTGKALSGINITIPGYAAALTDDKGVFSINAPGTSSVLIVSGPGYQEKQVPLKGRTNIAVSLYEDAFNSVYDQALLPYGNTSKNQIPWAVSSFSTTDSWARSTETPDTYLQGRVAGVNVIRRSGTPSIGADLYLRGFNSLYGTNKPLYVVDGIIYDVNSYGSSLITGHATNPLADIDINDIDNITVIKDGASIYGTRGANGVILITTGRAKDVATKIDFATYGGFNMMPKQLPVMQASDYRTYLSDMLKTANLTDDQIQALPFMNDNKSNPDYFRYHNQTNWQDQVLTNSFNQNYQLKITGGDNIATYALSLGYTSNKGVTKNTDLTRYFTRFNANLNLSKKLTATANLSFTTSEQNLKDQGINLKTNPMYLGLIKSPFLPVNVLGNDGAISPNLADADIFGISNPTAAIQKIQDLNKNYRFSGSVGLNYDIAKYFKISTLLGITFDKVRENIFVPNNGIVHDTLSLAIATNRSGSNVQRLYSLYNDTRISYNQSFNNIHVVSVNLGARYNMSSSSADYGLGYNSATDNFVSVGNGVNLLRKVGGQEGDWNWLNMYLNTDYKLLNRYFLSFNLAIDGSSRFGTQVSEAMTVTNDNYRYAFLPSVAAGWLVSSEKFMADVKFIDMLKLRASFGLVGNDDIGNFNQDQYYVSQNLLGIEGLVRGNIANPGLKWETVRKWNFGIDVAILNERLNVSLDLFNNKTDGMLVYEPTISASGFPYAITNNGGMKTSGIDLSINGRLINKAVKWDLGLNLSTAKNEITQLPNNRLITTFGDASFLTEVGKAANLFYGFKTNGIYTSDAEAATAGLLSKDANGNLTPFKGGDVRFIDVNHDKVIDEKDMQVIGNPNPKFTGAISNVISYKRWSFDALITFSKGNDIYNYTRRALESMSGWENQTLAVINRWRANGQVTNTPRAVYGDPNGNSRFSDRWIEDGSYIRLRTLSITYDLPLKEGVIVKYAKIYATGNNIVTFTKYLGFDPEFSATSSIFSQGVDTGLEPQFRTVQLGVRIGF